MVCDSSANGPSKEPVLGALSLEATAISYSTSLTEAAPLPMLPRPFLQGN